MECRECSELLPLYVDESLTPEEIQTVCDHIEVCSHCREEMALLKETINMVKNLECIDAPEDFHVRFKKRFDAECRPGIRWSLWSPLSLGTVAAAATALLVVVLYNPFASKTPPVGTRNASSDLSKKETSQSAALPTDTQPEAAPQAAPAQAKAAAEKVDTEIGSMVADVPSVNRINPLYSARAIQAGYGGAAQTVAARKPGYQMAAAPANEEGALLRQRGEWSGNHCGLHQSVTRAFSTAQELAAFWKASGIQSIALPEIDWNRNMLGFICTGDQPGRGYEIMLLEIQKKDDAVTVRYHINRQNVTQDGNTTQPFMLFTLPRTNQPVSFLLES